MILRILSVSFWTIPVVVFRFWPRQTNAITFNGEMQLLLHKFFVLAKFDCSFCWLNFPMYACYSVCLLLLGFFFFFLPPVFYTEHKSFWCGLCLFDNSHLVSSFRCIFFQPLYAFHFDTGVNDFTYPLFLFFLPSLFICQLMEILFGKLPEIKTFFRWRGFKFFS